MPVPEEPTQPERAGGATTAPSDRSAAETRSRIVEAGCELLRASSVRDWHALTIRAVAERAGVNERTVYRHFTNERGVRDAVMARLEEQAGIDLAGFTLDDVVDVTERIFDSVSSHPIESATVARPDARRRRVGASGRRCCEP